MRRTLMRIALGALLAGLSPGRARALSLRSSTAELVVALKAGGETRAGPLAVTNTGQERAELSLEVLRPTAAELKDGYEPIPDPGWIRLERPVHGLDPGGVGSTEALIASPRKKGLGKSGLKPGWYQAQWVGEATTAAGLKLRLPSKLLLRLRPERRKLEERRRKAKRAAGLEWMLSAGDGRALKLANPNETPVAFEAEAVDPAQAPDAPELAKGWEWAPNPDWLRPIEEFVEVRPGKVGELRLAAEIPDQERYRGRKWAFLVEVRMLEDIEAKPRRHLMLVETP